MVGAGVGGVVSGPEKGAASPAVATVTEDVSGDPHGTGISVWWHGSLKISARMAGGTLEIHPFPLPFPRIALSFEQGSGAMAGPATTAGVGSAVVTSLSGQVPKAWPSCMSVIKDGLTAGSAAAAEIALGHWSL